MVGFLFKIPSASTSRIPRDVKFTSWLLPYCSWLAYFHFLHPFPPLNGRLSSYQSFLDILNEMNDFAGQRELIAENMMMNICIDLTKYLQELKQERKMVRVIMGGVGVGGCVGLICRLNVFIIFPYVCLLHAGGT